ncbi:5-carboxymethyl-2-hydroxymuconate Delta-isomerase [Kushneria sp. TE3]|uniref:5-carboxymethyl-2-hydroxymuconate Delta-isomerase n=1 Tax=Kushneria sp. TE3 TaxID=3449832 RepID=UPI003F6851FA
MPTLLFHHPRTLGDDTLEGLVDALHRCTLDSGLFEARAIKVATLSLSNTRQGGEKRPFASLQVRLFAGRTQAQRLALSNALLAVINESLGEQMSATVEIVETDPTTFSR